MASVAQYMTADGQTTYCVRYRVDGRQTNKRGFTHCKEAKEYADRIDASQAGEWLLLALDCDTDECIIWPYSTDSRRNGESYGSVTMTHAGPRQRARHSII